MVDHTFEYSPYDRVNCNTQTRKYETLDGRVAPTKIPYDFSFSCFAAASSNDWAFAVPKNGVQMNDLKNAHIQIIWFTYQMLHLQLIQEITLYRRYNSSNNLITHSTSLSKQTSVYSVSSLATMRFTLQIVSQLAMLIFVGCNIVYNYCWQYRYDTKL